MSQTIRQRRALTQRTLSAYNAADDQPSGLRDYKDLPVYSDIEQQRAEFSFAGIVCLMILGVFLGTLAVLYVDGFDNMALRCAAEAKK